MANGIILFLFLMGCFFNVFGVFVKQVLYQSRVDGMHYAIKVFIQPDDEGIFLPVQIEILFFCICRPFISLIC